jgi:DNA-binding LacI/PurR family transcriptional regulator
MDNEKETKQARVTLKTVAEHTGLTPGTISAVLNNSSAADRIPQRTRDRIFAAARQLNYQPNPLARALRTGKAAAAGADIPEVPSGALVIFGAGQFERALRAIQQAGLRVADDFSVLDVGGFTGAWTYSGFTSVPDYAAFDRLAPKPS